MSTRKPISEPFTAPASYLTFLNKDLAERRKKMNGMDYLNSKNLYKPFRNGDLATLKDRLSGRTISKSIDRHLQQRNLLNKLAIKMPKMMM